MSGARDGLQVDMNGYTVREMKQAVVEVRGCREYACTLSCMGSRANGSEQQYQ